MADSRYRRVSRKRVCSICGKSDWCSFTPDSGISFCARVTSGADRVSKTGWGVFYHDPNSRAGPIPFPLPKLQKLGIRELAPIEMRDFAYRSLIDLAPAKDSLEILNGPKGLFPRRIFDFQNYGALPLLRIERTDLANRIEQLLRHRFSRLAGFLRTGTSGIPGFWKESRGEPRLWRNYDYANPIMLIPFRDENGFIQACQIRLMGSFAAKKRVRYLWLSTPELKGGSSCGAPLHFARYDSRANKKPVLITEGALKAETVAAFERNLDIIATSGVSCSHNDIISATRFRPFFLAFDRDMTENPHVARAVVRLLVHRHLDERQHQYINDIRILFWDHGATGIDDALIARIPICRLTLADWFVSLSSLCKDEVEDYFEQRDLSLKDFLTRGG